MTRTVRGVLEHYVAPNHVDQLLADLREVLTTGGVWRTRPVPARQLVAGDVVLDKAGAVWMVEGVRDDRNTLAVGLVRRPRSTTLHAAPDRTVPTLLAAEDQRAVALIETALGGTVVERVGR